MKDTILNICRMAQFQNIDIPGIINLLILSGYYWRKQNIKHWGDSMWILTRQSLGQHLTIFLKAVHIIYLFFSYKKPGQRTLWIQTGRLHTVHIHKCVVFFVLPRWTASQSKTSYKRSRWWCEGGERHRQERGLDVYGKSKGINIWAEKWAFTLIVACQAPICFNPVGHASLLRCCLQRNVQTQGAQWDNLKLFWGFCFLKYICYWK